MQPGRNSTHISVSRWDALIARRPRPRPHLLNEDQGLGARLVLPAGVTRHEDAVRAQRQRLARAALGLRKVGLRPRDKGSNTHGAT